jgi:hypothetical protein
MTRRLGILDQHALRLTDIQSVIATMRPLDGAAEIPGLASGAMPSHYRLRYVF